MINNLTDKSGACFKIGQVNFQADVHQPNMVNILSKEHNRLSQCLKVGDINEVQLI